MQKYTIKNSNKQTKIKQIKENQPIKSITLRKLVKYNCEECNGKEVDLRIKKKHTYLEEQLKNYLSRLNWLVKKHKLKKIQVVKTPIVYNKKIDLATFSLSSFESSNDDINKEKNQKSEKLKFRKIYDQFYHTDIFETNQDEESNQSSSFANEFYQLADDERLFKKEFNLSENDKIPFDHFSASNLNDNDTNLNSEYTNISAIFCDLWIFF